MPSDFIVFSMSYFVMFKSVEWTAEGLQWNA